VPDSSLDRHGRDHDIVAPGDITATTSWIR
jgi:hypothetical protein